MNRFFVGIIVTFLSASVFAQEVKKDSLFIPEADNAPAFELKKAGSDSVVITPQESVIIFTKPVFTLQLSDSTPFDYDHFGDILKNIPGIFVRDLGSVGQFLSAQFSPVPSSFINLRLILLDSFTLSLFNIFIIILVPTL